MNIGMDGMILMGAFFGVLGSWLFASAAAGVALAVGVGLLVGLFFALFVVKLRPMNSSSAARSTRSHSA